MVPWHPGKDKGAQKGLKFNFSEKGGLYKKNHRSLPKSLYNMRSKPNRSNHMTWGDPIKQISRNRQVDRSVQTNQIKNNLKSSLHTHQNRKFSLKETSAQNSDQSNQIGNLIKKQTKTNQNTKTRSHKSDQYTRSTKPDQPNWSSKSDPQPKSGQTESPKISPATKSDQKWVLSVARSVWEGSAC